jgi:serine/threonine protein kinase
MVKKRLTCTCGYTWEHSGSGTFPLDLRSICPLCTSVSNPKAQDLTATNEQTLPLEGEDAPLRFLPGQVISGFEILEEINRGGMGVIYKARQQGLNRLVALKMILADRLASDEARARFHREVQAAALLGHPNIVTVFQTDLNGPTPYLAMEYVPGIDLSRLVKRSGPLAVADALYYVQQAAHGLQHAYEQGLVHRDIKPANLMVTPSPLEPGAAPPGRKAWVKILDMGLARVVSQGDTVEEMTSLTQAGMFLGTPDYVSPEQAEDPRAVDIRSDLYSLGGTL